jgi:hypothetical protein
MPSYYKTLLIMGSLILINALIYQNCSPTSFKSDGAQIVQAKDQLTGSNTPIALPTPPLDGAPVVISPSEVGYCLTPISCVDKKKRETCDSRKTEDDKDLSKNKDTDDDDKNEFCSDDRDPSGDSEASKLVDGQSVKMIKVRGAGESAAAKVCMSRKACEFLSPHLSQFQEIKDGARSDDENGKGDKIKNSKERDSENEREDEGPSLTAKTLFKPIPTANCGQIIPDSEIIKLISVKPSK